MLARSSFTVLIIDDLPEDRSAYRGYLNQDERYSYHVLEAESVHQALALCEQNQPDLILLDARLPDEDGFVFLRAWQARSGNTPAPVVMLTEQDNETIAVAALKQGAQNYLLKGSLTAKELNHTVHSLLERLDLLDRLEKKRKQQELLAKVTLWIRQSFPVKILLQMAVEEVLQLLQADRVFIYRIWDNGTGSVIAEAVLPGYLQILGQSFPKEVFSPDCHQGNICAIARVEGEDISPCLVDLIQQFGVQAQLVIPIIQTHEQQDLLWGLLILHQCRSPRQWQDWEVELLQQLSTQMAIAIQQSQRYEQIQAELQKQQQVAAEFQALVENASDIIYRIDSEMHYLYFNPAVERLLSQPIDRLIGKTPKNLGVSDEIILKWQQLLERITLTHCEETIEHPFPDRDSPIWFQTRVVPELDATGKVHSFLCIARDISDRKAVEQELFSLNQELEARVEQRTAQLQESQRFIHSIADQIPAALYIYDLDENRNIYCNPKVAVTLGYSPEQIQALGVSLLPSLAHPDDGESLILHFERLRSLGDGEQRFLEYRLRSATGEWRWYLSCDTPFLRNKQGQVCQIIGTAQDITDRKRMEEQLRRSETHLRTAQRLAQLGSWEFDAATEEFFWSEEVFHQFGRSREKGTPTYEEFQQMLHPDDREFHHHSVQQTIELGQPYDLEFRIYHSDGTLRYLHARGEPIFNQSNQVIRLIGTSLDITERKSVERRLQLKAQILNQTHDSVISTDLQGIITSWNQGAKRMLGYSAEEALGQPISLIYPQSKMLQALEKKASNPLKIKGNHEAEVKAQCKSGESIDVLLSLSLLRDRDQNPIGVIGFLMDITKRKRAELTLRQNEEFQKRLIDSSSDCIKVLDLEGRLIYLNQGSLCLLEINEPTSVLNTQWLNFWPDEERTKAELALMTAKAGKLSRFQGYCPTTKGLPKWWDVAVSPMFDRTGQVFQLLVTSRDITEQKQAEVQLQQLNERLTLTNAELYRATRLKDEFLANMSHELRTPLNTILGLSEVLQDEILGKLNDRQQSAIQSIEQSGQQLLVLVNGILDLATVKSGKLELQLAPANIASLCTSSVTFVRQQALVKNLQLTPEIPSNLPDIMVDELRINQVLINLLSNAIKFTPDGGKIKLVVQREQCPEQSFLSLSVIDTGIGIAQEDVGKLFQPFTQIDSQLNRRYDGIGLGLSLVRRLVELHQGTISVSSEFGKGSCFTVRLPYRLSAQESPLSTPPGELSVALPSLPLLNQEQTVHNPAQLTTQGQVSVRANSARALILLAEDNEANAISIASYLEGRGYRWIRAYNGPEAMALAITHQPDLILIDIEMPENGLEAIRRLRAEPILRSIPIITVTPLAISQEGCLQAGANSYISKPIKLKQLVIEIQRLLAG
ncbi:MAG: PAS domain S-box protein [Actinomycetota bacterium]